MIDLLPRPTPGAPPLPAVPEPVRAVLENGLRVLVVPHRTLPQVTMRLVLPAGAAADPVALPGTAALVGSMLAEGTRALSADELNRRLDSLGASLDAQVGHDFAQVDLFVLRETLVEGVGLLAGIVTEPAFPDEQLARVRAETLDALEARDDEPANVADDRLARELFGAAHPYGRPALGTRAAVESITSLDLHALHAARYRPRGSVLVVAGDVEVDALLRLLGDAFGGWRGEAEPPTYPPPSQSGAREVYVPREDAAQGEIRYGAPGMSRRDPDWVPAAVANYLLGGSTITGRLGANLREDKGWTYGVRSGFAAAVEPGGWVVETAVDGEVVAAAQREIDGEIERFLAGPVPEDELQRAKDALILSLPRAFETPGRIVGRLATVEAYGLPEGYWRAFPERVRSVTTSDVLEMARRYFDAERLLRVVVGPPRTTVEVEP
jgi:zinc protease